MTIQVRSADLDRDRTLLVSTLSKHLTPLSDARRFEWLYLQNPDGQARAWVALNGTTGEAIGASAAFPRRMLVNGRERLGWVLGDFCISSEYRSLGPALQLQKMALGAVDSGEADFCYDFPSMPMTAIYKRLGVNSKTQLVRFSKLLRVNWRPQVLSLIVNPLLSLFQCRPRRGPWAFDFHEGECGEEFTRVARSAARHTGAQVLRSAEYLNWRYLRHPFVSYRLLTARLAGELHGYIVLTYVGQNVEIVEMSAAGDEIITALLESLIARLSNAGFFHIHVFLTSGDSRKWLLRKKGFWPRESRPVMFYWSASSGEFLNDRFLGPLLMQGDRDS